MAEPSRGGQEPWPRWSAAAAWSAVAQRQEEVEPGTDVLTVPAAKGYSHGFYAQRCVGFGRGARRGERARGVARVLRRHLGQGRLRAGRLVRRLHGADRRQGRGLLRAAVLDRGDAAGLAQHLERPRPGAHLDRNRLTVEREIHGNTPLLPARSVHQCPVRLLPGAALLLTNAATADQRGYC